MSFPEIPLKQKYPNGEAIAICAEILGRVATSQAFRRNFIRWKQFLGIQKPGQTLYTLPFDALEILVEFCCWKRFIASGNTPHSEFWDWNPGQSTELLKIRANHD